MTTSKTMLQELKGTATDQRAIGNDSNPVSYRISQPYSVDDGT